MSARRPADDKRAQAQQKLGLIQKQIESALAIGDKQKARQIYEQWKAKNPKIAEWVFYHLKPGDRARLVKQDRNWIRPAVITTTIIVVVLVVIIVGIALTRTGQGKTPPTIASLIQPTLNPVDLTKTAIVATNNQVAVLLTETQVAEAASLTQAVVSATPAATNTPIYSLPTAIPTQAAITPTSAGVRSDLPTLPDLPGKLYTWSAGGMGGFGRLGVYQFNGTSLESPATDALQFPTVDVDDTVLVYMQKVTLSMEDIQNGKGTLDGWELFRKDLQNPGAEGEPLNAIYGNQKFSEPSYPRFSADGTRLVFVATSPENTSAVYVVDFIEGNTLRVTSDRAKYTSAAISPDGSEVVAVKDDIKGTDLVLIDLTDGAGGYPQTPLTTDGDAMVEALPAYSPNGYTIVYSVTASNTPAQGDLYILQMSRGRSAGSIPIMTVDGDDSYASFDPTGNFIVFASNRVNHVYNIYVYDINRRIAYQFAGAQSVYPGAWTN